MYAGFGTYGGQAGLGGSWGRGVLGTYGGQAGLGYTYTAYGTDPFPTSDPAPTSTPTEGTDPYAVPEGVQDWFEMGQDTVSLWQQITGSSHCWTGYGNQPFKEPCAGTPNYDAVARAVATAPQAAIDQLIHYLRAGNDGRGPKTRQELQNPKCIPFWVKAVMGGKGCVATKFPEAPAWFQEFVLTYGAPESAGDWIPGSSIPGAITNGAGAAKIGAGALAAIAAVFLIPKMLG